MSKFKFDKAIQILQQQKSDLPKALAEATQNYFNQSFDNQAWNNKPWSGRKPQKRVNTKPLLQKTGALKTAVSKSLITADFTSLKFAVSGIPYAQVHNQGLKAGRGKHFKMPKRQFMGHTAELAKIQKEIIKTYMDKVLK